MNNILDFVSFGENISEKITSEKATLDLLKKLEEQLERNGYKWKDVSLLMIANSKLIDTHENQVESDQNIISGLNQFCNDKNWFPSFMGISAHTSFFSDIMERKTEIDDGLLLITVISPILERIPVVYEISPDKETRKYAGTNVIKDGAKKYANEIVKKFGVESGPVDVFGTSTGLLFTTGIGHIAQAEFIDFNDSYEIGQEIMDKFHNDHAKIVGGCSSNRSADQFQCIYYSEYSNDKPSYKFTYKHAAVFTLLPHSAARFLLQHPYEICNDVPLKIEFNSKDQYSVGRNFYLKTINGMSPVDYWAEQWQFTTDEIYKMEREKTPIPAVAKTSPRTIGSSKSIYDKNIWPNVGGWFEKVDGEVLLRLVRAEDSDSNYYLMCMEPDSITKNCETLSEYFQNNIGKESTLMSFVCESRKYYLDSLNSNIEAESILSLIPDSTKKIGIYVNGEYSVGIPGAIGYHNFSQLSMIVPNRDLKELPFHIFKSLKSKEVKLFLSHAREDAPFVREFMTYMSKDLQSYWMDEDEMSAGEILKEKIKQAIQKDTQYFVVFISRSSLNSAWVEDELRWKIKVEVETGKTLILPILLDDVWKELASKWDSENANYLTNKLYIKCLERSKDSVKMAATRLSVSIKDLIKREGN